MAGRYDFTIERGASVTKVFVWKNSTGTPVDMTGYSAKFSMRTSPSSPTEVLVRQTSDGSLYTDLPNGVLQISIPALGTSALTEARYVYDLLVTSPANYKTRLVQGVITISPEVTR